MAKEILQEDIGQIKELLKKVLGTESYKELSRMGGLTNHTYKVTLESGEEYVVRIPGEGTEELICRKDEKVSTELACKLGIDAELLYFGEDGSKVTRYITDAVTMNAASMREPKVISDVAEIFRKLHTSNEDTKVPFEVFDMAADYEKIIYSNNVPMYDDYQQIKSRVMQIKDKVDSQGAVKKVPCHNDSLCENWVYGGDRLYLIDWEYAGMNDGMWDLADVSIEAGYEADHDSRLLNAYFGREASREEYERFVANKLYLDYLWTLWGKTRVPYDGQEMEDYALERYERLKKNLQLI